MCATCRENARKQITALIEGEHELCDYSRKFAAQYCEDHPELPENAAEDIYDALIAAQVALCAAIMASKTRNFTTEGGMDVAMILGTWAGSAIETAHFMDEMNFMRLLLGMGDN